MVVHPVSHGVSRVPRYSGSRLSAPAFGYGALTLSSRPSHAVLLASSDRDVCPQPRRINPPVWPPPRSLATTCGISVDFFSSPYLDVSVQAVPSVYLCVQYTVHELSHADCSIRTSADRCLLATPRSFSQLVTSFFGS